MGHEVEPIEEMASDETDQPSLPDEETAPPAQDTETELVAVKAIPAVIMPAPEIEATAEPGTQHVETDSINADDPPQSPPAHDAPVTQIPPVIEHISAPPGSYRITDFSQFNADPEQFFEFGYRGTLRAMIDAVMETESPIRADILAQRIARAHGWLRTGGRIRERLDLHLDALDRTVESSGDFIWKKDSVTELLDYRPPANDSARRSIADIPLAELASVVVANPALLDQTDPVRDFARLLGLERVTAVSRSRLSEAIGRAKTHLSTTQPDV